MSCNEQAHVVYISFGTYFFFFRTELIVVLCW